MLPCLWLQAHWLRSRGGHAAGSRRRRRLRVQGTPQGPGGTASPGAGAPHRPSRACLSPPSGAPPRSADARRRCCRSHQNGGGVAMTASCWQHCGLEHITRVMAGSRLTAPGARSEALQQQANHCKWSTCRRRKEDSRKREKVVPDVPTAGVRGWPGPEPRKEQQRRQHAHRYLQTWHCPAVFHQLASARPAAGGHYRSECFLSCRRFVTLSQVGIPRRACAPPLVDARMLAFRGPWRGSLAAHH